MKKLEMTVWSQEADEAPRIPDDRRGLDFRAVPAEGEQGSTLALHGAVRLPYRFLETYGGSLESAIAIVAIDKPSGTLFHGRPTHVDTAPFYPKLPGPEKPIPAGMEDVFVTKAFFNIDLCAHFSLPPQQAEYRVFCWIESFVSPVRVVEVPEEPRRFKNTPRHATLTLSDREAAAHERMPARADGIGLKVVCENVYVPSLGEERVQAKVYGHAGQGLLQAETDGDQAHLHLLARTHCGTALEAHRVQFPDPASWKGSFAVDLGALIDVPKGEDLIQLLACYGETLSPVLQVPTPLKEGVWETSSE